MLTIAFLISFLSVMPPESGVTFEKSKILMAFQDEGSEDYFEINFCNAAPKGFYLGMIKNTEGAEIYFRASLDNLEIKEGIISFDLTKFQCSLDPINSEDQTLTNLVEWEEWPPEIQFSLYFTCLLEGNLWQIKRMEFGKMSVFESFSFRSTNVTCSGQD